MKNNNLLLQKAGYIIQRLGEYKFAEYIINMKIENDYPAEIYIYFDLCKIVVKLNMYKVQFSCFLTSFMDKLDNPCWERKYNYGNIRNSFDEVAYLINNILEV
jgi:hypothetical protein